MSPDFLALDENLEISYDQIDPYGISETPFPINQAEWSMVATKFFFDMGTEFLAPASKSLVAILPRVYFRSQWTGMLWCYFEQYQLTFSEHKFASCETYVYSRSQYPLIDSRALVSLVRYIGLYFRAQHLKPSNLLGVFDLSCDWYICQAFVLFTARIDCWLWCRALSIFGIQPFLVYLMTRSLEFYSKKVVVTLIVNLVNVFLIYIGYVIAYDLFPLRIQKPSIAFHRVLACCMLNWNQKKEQFEGLVA